MTARNTVDFFSRTAPEKAEAQALRSATPVSTAVAAATDYPGVTIVVPCFNEEPMLPYLQGKLRSMREALSDKYDVHLILADDGSTDNTWQVMQDLFGYEANCSLVRQEQNLGVAGTILNGIRRSKTEIVCSIESDCTYEHRGLTKPLPMLPQEVEFVKW